MAQPVPTRGGGVRLASQFSVQHGLPQVGATIAQGAYRAVSDKNRVIAPDRGSYPFGAPPCRISRPARSVMQAGRDQTRTWVLEFEPRGSRWLEPLMGWTATDDPFVQIRLTFPTHAAASGYAERMGLDYTVVKPALERPKQRVGGVPNRMTSESQTDRGGSRSIRADSQKGA